MAKSRKGSRKVSRKGSRKGSRKCHGVGAVVVKSHRHGSKRVACYRRRKPRSHKSRK
jgi:hypothetical protein